MNFGDFNSILELSVALSLTSDIFKDQIEKFNKKFNNLKEDIIIKYEISIEDLQKQTNKDSEISNINAFFDRFDENLKDFDKDSWYFKVYKSLMFGKFNVYSLIISIVLLFTAAHCQNGFRNNFDYLFIISTYLVFFRPFIGYLFFKFYLYSKKKKILELEKTFIGNK